MLVLTRKAEEAVIVCPSTRFEEAAKAEFAKLNLPPEEAAVALSALMRLVKETDFFRHKLTVCRIRGDRTSLGFEAGPQTYFGRA